jgi:hypothetical protein
VSGGVRFFPDAAADIAVGMSPTGFLSCTKEASVMARIKLTEENRFSTYVKSRNSPQYRDLEKWQQWFASRGIPSVIACSRSGYALYREGLLPVDIHDESPASAEGNGSKVFFAPTTEHSESVPSQTLNDDLANPNVRMATA